MDQWRFLQLQSLLPVLLITILSSMAVLSADNPCEDPSAVFLPREGLCLLHVKNAKDWVEAQSECETGGGSLFRLSSQGQLKFSGDLSACLAARPTNTSDDYWIGAVSKSSRHWLWINGSLLNPIKYVTGNVSAVSTSPFQVCSQYLNVDYCVSVCHDDGAAYTVLHHRTRYYCCFCSFYLETSQVKTVNVSYFEPDNSSFYIATAREGNLIRLSSSETFSDTQTLCATVDSKTYEKRELFTRTCFSKSPFLCRLGPNAECNNPECNGVRCKFRVQDECIQSDGRPLTWFEARSECMASGGDLWTLGKLDDMYQVTQHIIPDTPYWLGATEHVWSFDAESDIFGKTAPDYELVRCGHMFLERSGVAAQSLEWKWADTRCDQHKSYICQYKQTIHTPSTTTTSLICPWTIPVPTFVVTSSPGSGNLTSAGSLLKPQELNSGKGSDLIAAIVAACVAALVFMLCVIFMSVYIRRRKWLLEKWKRNRRYLWPFSAATPGYLPADFHTDTLSNGHTRLQSDSESVFGSGAFIYPDGSSNGAAYMNQSRSRRNGPETGDGRSKRNESFEKGSKLGVHSQASVTSGDLAGSSSAGGLESVYAITRDLGGGVTLQSDEQLMSASYSSLTPHAREYVTLSAHMNIKDDTDSPYQSMRDRKPEVALATKDIDLSFTVNHAFSRSRQGSEQSSERGVEELDLPLGSTLIIPTRAVEESLVYY